VSTKWQPIDQGRDDKNIEYFVRYRLGNECNLWLEQKNINRQLKNCMYFLIILTYCEILTRQGIFSKYTYAGFYFVGVSICPAIDYWPYITFLRRAIRRYVH